MLQQIFCALEIAIEFYFCLSFYHNKDMTKNFLNPNFLISLSGLSLYPHISRLKARLKRVFSTAANKD